MLIKNAGRHEENQLAVLRWFKTTSKLFYWFTLVNETDNSTRASVVIDIRQRRYVNFCTSGGRIPSSLSADPKQTFDVPDGWQNRATHSGLNVSD